MPVGFQFGGELDKFWKKEGWKAEFAQSSLPHAHEPIWKNSLVRLELTADYSSNMLQ